VPDSIPSLTENTNQITYNSPFHPIAAKPRTLRARSILVRGGISWSAEPTISIGADLVKRN